MSSWNLSFFSARPRGDVKPLAKALLKRFGSFAGVIHADETALRATDEVGDAVVAALKTIRIAAQRLIKSEISDQPVIQSWSALMHFYTLGCIPSCLLSFLARHFYGQSLRLIL